MPLKFIQTMRDKKEQVEEYSNIYSSVLSHTNLRSGWDSLHNFEATEDDARRFLLCFVQNAITDQYLQERLSSSLLDNEWEIKGKPIKTPDGGEAAGSCNWNNGKFTKWVALGVASSRDPSVHITDFRLIRCWMHEATHSISQKHDAGWRSTQMVPEKDQSVGEIEAKFMEKVFVDFVRRNAEVLGDQNFFPGQNEYTFTREMNTLEKNDRLDFISRLKSGIDNPQGGYKDSFSHRYVIGEIVASLLFEEYKQDPVETMHLFSQFLQINAQLDVDECVAFLTKGEYQSYPEAIEAYKGLLNSRGRII